DPRSRRTVFRAFIGGKRSGRFHRFISETIRPILSAVLMAKLIFTDPNFSGRAYELALEKTTVGRGEQNTLVIRDNSVSLAHCEILMHGSEIIVRDLDSSNGTFVQGIRLNKQSQVKSGQTVRF